MAEKVTVSVRNLVEFILRSGDIDNTRGYKDPDAMQEGSRIHRKIQKSMPSGYAAEVSLKTEIPLTNGEEEILLSKVNNNVEIKTSAKNDRFSVG